MSRKNILYLMYLISFLEGSALMASELIASKLLAPYFGTSLYVWTALFIATLGGLALGYYLGGIVSTKENRLNWLKAVLITSLALTAALSPISNVIMESTINLPLQSGALISSMVFLFPLLVSFGMVSPLMIRIISEDASNVGKNSGNIYTISTLGGIIMSLYMGFYAIPYIGIKTSILVTSMSLLIALAILLFASNKLIKS